MPMACLTDQQLSLLSRRGEAGPALTEHLQQCESCQKRLAVLQGGQAVAADLEGLLGSDAADYTFGSDIHLSGFAGSEADAGPQPAAAAVPMDSISSNASWDRPRALAHSTALAKAGCSVSTISGAS